jgi:hypothetical protein
MEEVPVKYRKRKEMTPERLALLEKAREKAQLVIQEREKLKNAPVPDTPKNTTTVRQRFVGQNKVQAS